MDRRRFLSVMGVTALAGCAGDNSSESDTETATDTPTPEPTPTEEPTPTPTPTEEPIDGIEIVSPTDSTPAQETITVRAQTSLDAGTEVEGRMRSESDRPFLGSSTGTVSEDGSVTVDFSVGEDRSGISVSISLTSDAAADSVTVDLT